jgi:hypothetical protein
LAADDPVEASQPEQAPVSFSGLTDEFGRIKPEFLEQERREAGYNAADPRQIEAARREAGQAKREDADFWRVAMATPQRRAALYRLLESCSIYGTAADFGTASSGSDALRTYFNLGREDVGKRIMVAAMEASLDLYLTMMKEHKAAEDSRERKNSGKDNA